METIDVINLWKRQNALMEKQLVVNKRLLNEMIRYRTSSSLRGVRLIRWIGIFAGVLWCLVFGFIAIVSWLEGNIFFSASVSVNVIVTATATGLYISHLRLLDAVDVSETIVEAQQKLIKLKESNLKTLGLLWLQLPVFSTWYMSTEWMEQSPLTFWGIQVPVVLLQAFIGFWLYRNLNYRNHDKKWFRWFVSKGEFASIEKAITFMKATEGEGDE